MSCHSCRAWSEKQVYIQTPGFLCMQDACIHKTCPVSHRLWVKHNWLLFYFCCYFHQLLGTSPVQPLFFFLIQSTKYTLFFQTTKHFSFIHTASIFSCRQAPCFCAAASSALSTPPARSMSLSGPVRTKLTTAPHPPSSVSILVVKSAVGARPRSVLQDGRDRV